MARGIVIGIDGMPPALLDRLAAEGRIPVLASLCERGSTATLRSTPNYQSASAWTSLVTGVNPGKHGVFHFTNPRAGDYGHDQIDSRAVRSPTIWRLLSDTGLRVAALNVPVSFPVEPVDGVMVGCWLCPSMRSSGFTHPPELAGEIMRSCGDYPIHPDLRRHVAAGDYARACAVAADGIRAKLQVARWLLGREAPDLLWVVTTEIDSLQHWCWDLIDEGHPAHDPALAGRWGEEILRVYSILDEEIGCLLHEVGPEADVLVVSDHGQAPNSGAQLLLRPWLIDAGYLALKRRPLSRRSTDALLRCGFGLVQSRAPKRLKATLRARFGAAQSRAQAGVRGGEPDWERTRAWTEAGHLFINLKGRQPEGIVSAGAEYDELVEEVTAGLLDLRDGRTGVRVVAEVAGGEDLFSGDHARIMPDLLVHWRNDLSVASLRCSGGGEAREVRHPAPPAAPPGAHHPDGIVIAAGPSFRAQVQAPAQSVYDVTPTLLHLLGRPLPEWMDGGVMTELLTDAAAEDVRTATVKDAKSRPAGAPAWVAEAQERDAAEIRSRLRALGYLD